MPKTQLTDVSFSTIVGRLSCDGCDCVSDANATGWVAAIIGGFDLGPLEVCVFCPDCAAREFPDPWPGGNAR